MKNFLNKNKAKLSKVNLSFALAVILLIVGFVIIYSYTVNKIQSLLINQAYQKAELATSAGASSFKIFLEMSENSLLLLSKNPSIVNQDTKAQKTLDKFIQDWAETPIISVAHFNKDGALRFIANNMGKSYYTDDNPVVGDKNLLAWAKKASENDVYLGKPLIPKIKSSDPEYIFPLITPIYKNGKFNGVLALAISLSKLTDSYLDPLRIIPDSRTYLIHSDGTILAGPSENIELVGVNYFDYIRNKPYPGSEEALQELTKAVENKNSGKLNVILHSLIEKRHVRYILAYSPIINNGEHWTLALSIPITNIIDANPNFLKESKVMIFSLFVYLLMTVSFISILIVKNSHKNTSSDNLKKGEKQKT